MYMGQNVLVSRFYIWSPPESQQPVRAGTRSLLVTAVVTIWPTQHLAQKGNQRILAEWTSEQAWEETLPAPTDHEGYSGIHNLLFHWKVNSSPRWAQGTAWVRVKAWANVLVQSPIDGGQGVGEPHVIGQFAQLINVKEEVGLVSFF